MADFLDTRSHFNRFAGHYLIFKFFTDVLKYIVIHRLREAVNCENECRKCDVKMRGGGGHPLREVVKAEKKAVCLQPLVTSFLYSVSVSDPC